MFYYDEELRNVQTCRSQDKIELKPRKSQAGELLVKLGYVQCSADWSGSRLSVCFCAEWSPWSHCATHSPAHCGSHVAVAPLPAEKPGPASLSLGGSAWAVGCYWSVWLFSLRAKQSYNPDSAYFVGNLPLFMRNISLRGDSQQQPSGSGLRYNAFPGLITAWKQRLRWRRRFHIRSREEKTPPSRVLWACGECLRSFDGYCRH